MQIDRASVQGFSLSGKCAAVLGCGGLGCNIATHLSCAGIGKLILCDFDTVSASNLNRQFLYSVADLGKEKVSLAKAKLNGIAPETEIVTFQRKITAPQDLGFCSGADIVFLAVDNNAARAAAQTFCSQNGLPLVNGGVNGFYGTAYLYLPGKTPDLAAAGMLSAENGVTRSVSSTVGVIGALQVHLGIRYLLGDLTSAGKLHVFDGGEIHTLTIKGETL